MSASKAGEAAASDDVAASSAACERLARDPGGRVAARHRRPVRRRRACPCRPADPRRRRVLGRPDRRPRHREHRPHVSRRRRALAPRGRQPSPRARGGRRLLAVRRRPGRVPSHRAVGAPAGRAPRLGLVAAGRRRDVSRAVPAGVAGVRARDPGHHPRRRAAVAGHRARPRAERPARRGVRVVGGEPWARPVDGRAPVHLGRSVRRHGSGRATTPPRRGRERGPRRGVRRRRRRRADRPARHPVDRGAGWRRRGAERALDVRSGRRPGALVGLRRRRAAGALGRAIGGRSASGSGVGRGGRGHVRPGPERASLGAVRDRLGPAGRRVRGRPPLVEALHEGVGPDRHARRRPRAARAGRGPGLATGDRGVAGTRPRRPGAPGLVQDGAVQRAVLPRRRRLVLGARRGGWPGAGSRRRRPVRAPRVRGLPLLRHRRRRLLRLVRAAGGLPRAGAPRHPRPPRGDPGRAPRDRHDRGVRRPGAAQGRRHRPPRRRRPPGRPVHPPQLVHVPGGQRLEGPGAQVRPPGVARRDRGRAGGGPRADRRRVADGGAASAPPVRARPAARPAHASSQARRIARPTTSRRPRRRRLLASLTTTIRFRPDAEAHIPWSSRRVRAGRCRSATSTSTTRAVRNSAVAHLVGRDARSSRRSPARPTWRPASIASPATAMPATSRLGSDPGLEAVGDFTQESGAASDGAAAYARPDIDAVFAASDLMRPVPCPC